MKQFLLFGMAMMATVTAVGANPCMPLLDGGPRDGIANGAYQLRSEEAMRLRRPGAVEDGPMCAAAPMGQYVGATAEIVLENIILTQPEGEVTMYSRDCGGYWAISTTTYQQRDRGGTVKIVKTGDNEVWLNNPLALMSLSSWIKGELSDDGSTITLKGAQAVYSETLDGETTIFYMTPLEFVKENEDGSGWYYPTADATYTYKLDPNSKVWKPTDLYQVYGLCRLVDGQLSWVGYGNYDQIMTPNYGVLQELPEGLTPEKWVVKYDTGGHLAEVVRADGKFYVRGLLDTAVEGWAIGTIDGQTVDFEVGQYLGVGHNQHYAYLYGGELRAIYNEDYGQYFNEFFALRKLQFEYSASNKTLTNCSGACVVSQYERANSDPDGYPVQSYMSNPTVKYLVRDPECPPSDPYGISFFAFDDQVGYGFVDFRYANEDANGYILPKEDLYYRVFMNGKLHTFFPDEYATLDDPMVLVPYEFYDLYDFDVQGYLHTFYYFNQDLDTMGIQNIYKVNDVDTPLVSNLISFPVVGGIAGEPMAKKEEAQSEWFDLQGRKVSNPGAGMYIKRTVYTDGSVVTTKKIVK